MTVLRYTNPGSGLILPGDDLGGAGVVQYFKLYDGTPGSQAVIPGSADRGLVVEPRQALVKIAPVAQPTLGTGAAYASGDAIGGKLEFAAINRAAGKPVIVTNAVVVDKYKEVNAGLELVLFDDDFTAVADNAAFVIDAADVTKVVTTLDMGAQVVGGSAIYDQAGGNNWSGLVVPAVPTSTKLWGQLVVTGTPTISHGSTLTVVLFVRQL